MISLSPPTICNSAEQTQVSKVFTDKASGKDTQRPQLEALLSFVREGD
ncbi:recombinase family protein, partial [Klebsiella pneumoniae]